MTLTECWRWPVPTKRADQRPVASRQYVYRALYKLFVDDLADEMHLHHACHNTWCINPWHCEVKTPSEHALEHVARLRPPPRKHVCANGHDFDDPANVGVYVRMKRGKQVQERYCRACRSMWKKAKGGADPCPDCGVPYKGRWIARHKNNGQCEREQERIAGLGVLTS